MDVYFVYCVINLPKSVCNVTEKLVVIVVSVTAYLSQTKLYKTLVSLWNCRPCMSKHLSGST